MMNKPGKFTTAFILLTLSLLSACATAPQKDVNSIIAERAQARWDALLSKDYAAAYAFYSPGFRSTASVTDLEISIRLRRIRWTSAEYLKHDCDENTCKVFVRLGYKVATPVPGVKVWEGFDAVEEQWVKTGGEWWFMPAEQ